MLSCKNYSLKRAFFYFATVVTFVFLHVKNLLVSPPKLLSLFGSPLTFHDFVTLRGGSSFSLLKRRKGCARFETFVNSGIHLRWALLMVLLFGLTLEFRQCFVYNVFDELNSNELTQIVKLIIIVYSSLVSL